MNSISLCHCWTQSRGNQEVWCIKIHCCCRINVLFACFKFSSWCLVCISNVQLMMLGMHFKMCVLKWLRHVLLFAGFIACSLISSIWNLSWYAICVCPWCLVIEGGVKARNEKRRRPLVSFVFDLAGNAFDANCESVQVLKKQQSWGTLLAVGSCSIHVSSR